MKNDSKHIVNGKEAVFTVGVKKGIIFLFPIATFTFGDGDKIVIVHDTMKRTEYVENDSPIDFDIYYENGRWRKGKRG